MKTVKQMVKELDLKDLTRQDWKNLMDALAKWNLAVSSFKQMRYHKMVTLAMQAYRLVLAIEH